jgi:hypothetical protein
MGGEATQRLKRIKIKHRKKDAIFPAWIANFPDPARKFPVPFRREFSRNPLLGRSFSARLSLDSLQIAKNSASG